MITLEVKDMSCGHCVASIGKALQAVDAGVRFSIELERKLVRIEASSATAATLRDAVAEAGYTPVPLATGQS